VDQPETARQIRKGLVRILRHVSIRGWWDSKCKIFRPPDKRKKTDFQPVPFEVAYEERKNGKLNQKK